MADQHRPIPVALDNGQVGEYKSLDVWRPESLGHYETIRPYTERIKQLEDERDALRNMARALLAASHGLEAATGKTTRALLDAQAAISPLIYERAQ